MHRFGSPVSNLAQTQQEQVETKALIEITLVLEGAFENEMERKTWYNTHDLSQQETKDELNLRKVPTVYCPPKWISVVALHLLQAFSKNLPKQYHTTGTEVRFVAAPGALVCYSPKRLFSAYLSNTAKLATCTHNMVSVQGFISESFFKSLSLDPANPFNNITLYTIVNTMPRSESDPLPAFFQIGSVAKGKDIHAMCIPSL
eukprot:12885799-Ditylum_brightwellii.AAC.1